MSIIIAAFLIFLGASAVAVLMTSSAKLLRRLIKLHIAVATLFTIAFFFVAARLAVPFPDSGPAPSGHILEGVSAMFRVSQIFVGVLALIAFSSSLTALRLAKSKEHAA